MRVLVVCERSGVVRRAFGDRGHDAWSNDLVSADDGSIFHMKKDCHEAILHGEWDLIIMHPPCTALAVSGNRWYGEGKDGSKERAKSIKWTMDLWCLAVSLCDRVCMENPVGVLSSAFCPPTQYIQPWQFGHGETKKTGLWLYGLPELKHTTIVEGREQRIWKMPPSKERAALRSETYSGIADAMAEQWGSL